MAADCLTPTRRTEGTNLCPSEPAPSSASPSARSTEPALAQEVMAEPPPRPEDKKTVAGAEAFATYVVEALHHSVQQRDFSLLDSLMSEEGSCGTRANVEESVKASERKGRLEPMTEPVRVKRAELLDKENWLVGVLYRPRGQVDVLQLLSVRFEPLVTCAALVSL